ncbi:hypothetical protein [Clostridium botulinum]|uniref:hypothetical protein n=1 Tax=Clostridium botulinum TaxID=1491 RepID=UPI0007740AAA|nr:hypothetical protein [Clostridium botulinum]
MKKEREMELMLNGFKMEVKGILQNFNEIMNATLGDTVTITSSEGSETRKLTPYDTIDFYQNEWCNTIESLSEIGIELEEDMVPILEKENHTKVYEELQRYASIAKSDGAISYLEYNDVQIPYTNICMEDNVEGNTMLIPFLGESMGNDPQAFILLKKNSKYKVIDKIGDMEQPLLVEIK